MGHVERPDHEDLVKGMDMTDDQAIAAIDAAHKRLRDSLGTDRFADAYSDLRRIVNGIHWQREAAAWQASADRIAAMTAGAR
jgi:hypothetical protein